MSKENQTDQGGGFSPYLLIGFLVLLVGAIAVFVFSSGSSGSADETTQQVNQETPPAATEQNQPATIGSAEVQAPAVGATANVIATDDPYYLNCLETPLGQGETQEQRTAYCNQELERLQAQPDPSPASPSSPPSSP